MPHTDYDHIANFIEAQLDCASIEALIDEYFGDAPDTDGGE